MMEEKRGFQLSECPETNWGIVAMAGDGDEDRRATAFDSIVGTYYPVLLRYLKGHFRMSDDDAADCLQEFVLDKLIKKQIIQRASSEKGKFRYFLMRSIERFVLDRIRRRKAAKRAPNEMTICFEDWMKKGAESEGGLETLAAFDLAFAQFIVDRALLRMKERCLVDAKTNLWSLFEEKFLGVAFGGSKSLPNDTLVALLGLKSKREVFSLMAKAKTLYVEILDEVLGEFVGGDQISDELESLRHALARV